jgi:hypothetical protein
MKVLSPSGAVVTMPLKLCTVPDLIDEWIIDYPSILTIKDIDYVVGIHGDCCCFTRPSALFSSKLVADE